MQLSILNITIGPLSNHGFVVSTSMSGLISIFGHHNGHVRMNPGGSNSAHLVNSRSIGFTHGALEYM